MLDLALDPIELSSGRGFCVGPGGDIRHTARVLGDAEADGEAFDWCEAGKPNHRH